MPRVIACPDQEQLRKIALGDPSLPDGDALIEHIAHCSACATRLGSITADDAVVDAVRSKDQTAGPEPEVVRRLLEKVRGLVSETNSQDGQTIDAPPAAASVSGGTAMFSWVDSAKQEEEDDGFAPPQAADEIGRLGPYRILKVLGEGGMGKVFLAEDPALQRQVALKVMKKSLAVVRKSRERFLLEARAAAKIEHDNIIHIYQVGEDRGIPFLAMPLLKGSSLEDLLRRVGVLQLKQTLRIGIQIAEGLAAAHASNLIHRDIKPANIWIEPTGGGRVKILDFGLARTTQGETGLTQSGAILGTPAYMPPEQARGEKVDHRADLYSLGCVLYRMTTGEMPLKGNDTMSILMALATQEPAAPSLVKPAVPKALSDFIMRLLAKDPAQRVATAKEVVKALKAIERGDQAPSNTAILSESMLQPPASVPMANVLPSVETTNSLPSPLRGRGAGGEGAAPRKSHRPIALLTGVAALLLLLGAGGVIYQFAFQTADGTLLVEVDENADVRFKNGKLEIRDTKGNLLYTLSPSDKNKKLPPGDYLIDVVGADGLTVSTKVFSLTKNGEKSVRVSVAAAVAQKGKGPDDEPRKIATNAPSAYALAFDGQAWPVKLPTLKLSTDAAFTVEAWVRPDANVPSKQRWIVNLNQLAALRTNFTGYAWSFDVQGVSAVTPMKSLPARLVHLAGVYNRKEILLFVDGKLADRKEAKNLTFQQAKEATLGHDWRGLIGEVRISKVARYDKDFTPQQRFQRDKDTLALYHMEEGPSGDKLTDSSGNNHHGKIVGAKWVKADGTPIVPGKNGELAFDGNSSRVTIPSLKYTGESPLTVEAWAVLDRPISDWSDEVLMGDPQTAGLALGNGFGRQGEWQFAFFTNTYVWANEKQPLPRGQPIHLVGVYDGKSELRFYVNGKLQNRTPATGKYRSSPVPFTLGANADPNDEFSQFFRGRLTEVRISKVARYDQDFTPQKRFEPDKDTLALYHFDEGAGNVLKDSSGNNHHGKIVGAKWVKADGTPIASPASHDYALQFNGKDAAVAMPSLRYDGSHPITIEARVRNGQVTKNNGGHLAGWYGLFNIFTPRPGTYQCATYDAGGKGLFALQSVVPASQRFTHVAGVWNGKQLRVFVDGKSSSPTSVPSIGNSLKASGLVSDHFALGCSIDIGSASKGRRIGFFEGTIDEVRISKVARYDKDFTPQKRFEPDKDTLALYHFDEGAGNVLKDSSGNGHHGKIVGAKWVTADGTPAAALQGKTTWEGNGSFWPESLTVTERSGAAFRGVFTWGPKGKPEGVAEVAGQIDGDKLTFKETKILSASAAAQAYVKQTCVWTVTISGERIQGTWRRTKEIHGKVDLIRQGAPASVITPLDPAWLKAVAAMKAEQQVEAVKAELMKRNPGFDGKVTPSMNTDGVVIQVVLLTDHVTDIAPLRALPGLKLLICSGSFDGVQTKGQLADLSPLNDMKLTLLDCENTKVSDLSPLKNMSLQQLNVARNTGIADLSPLRDMPLTSLSISGTKVPDLTMLKGLKLKRLHFQGTSISDIAALRGMPLERLDFQYSRVSDLSPLKGMKLEDLNIMNSGVTDLSALKGTPLKTIWCDFKADRDGEILRSIPTLQTINGKDAKQFWKEADAERAAFVGWLKAVAAMKPQQQLEAVKAELIKRNPGFDGTMTPYFDKVSGVVGLTFLTDNVTDISPVRALPALRTLGISGSNPTRERNGKVANLAALIGMKLTKLHLSGTNVSDLSPLKDMKLTFLSCWNTPVSDLLPLKDMPLSGLDCRNSKVANLAPLRKMPLKNLSCDYEPKRDASILRSIPTLETINGKDAKEFLNGAKTSALPPLDPAWLKAVAAMKAEQQIEAVKAELMKRNPGFDASIVKHKFDAGEVTELEFVTDHVTDVSPVRALPGLRKLVVPGSGKALDFYKKNGKLADLTPLKGMNLTELDCHATPVSDLSSLTGMSLMRLNCSWTNVSDLNPLKEMKSVRFLYCIGAKVTDLSPLEGLNLTQTSFAYTEVADLSPLKHMSLTALGVGSKVSDLTQLKKMKLASTLTALNIDISAVTDLAPLKGMKLTTLSCYGAPVSDLSPLKDMKLTILDCRNTKVTDLSPLKGMPLVEFSGPVQSKVNAEILRAVPTIKLINSKPAADFWKEAAALPPLDPAWLKAVAAMKPQQQLDAVKAELMKRNPGFDGNFTISRAGGGAVNGIVLSTANVADLMPLRAFPKLAFVKIGGANGTGKLKDLAPLADLKSLNQLTCSLSQVSDLTPLKGLPIDVLNLSNTPVEDLTPLQGMKLGLLDIHNTRVKDVTPLKGMPLHKLYCDQAVIVSNAAILRSIPTLQTINSKAAATFWKEVDAKKLDKTP